MFINRKWIFAIVSSLIPMIPMLYLYQRNVEHLLLWHTLAVGGFMVLISCLGYFVFLKFYTNQSTAQLMTLISWLIFWSYGSILNFTDQLCLRKEVLILVFVSVWVCLALLNKFLLAKWTTSRFSGIICVFLGCLIIWNSVASLHAFYSKSNRLSKISESNGTIFKIDESLPTPNIYWIHSDGMLGFDAVEKYFGDAQTEFRKSLVKMGFVINPSANFEAKHKTVAAIPALMCPQFYDTALLSGLSYPMNISNTTLTNARVNNELIEAFKQRNYSINTIAGYSVYFFANVPRFYNIDNAEAPLINTDKDISIQSTVSKVSTSISVTNLKVLLKRLTMIRALPSGFSKYSFNNIIERGTAMPQYDEEVKSILGTSTKIHSTETLVRSLCDSMQGNKPKLTVIHYLLPHRPFIYDEGGNLHENDIEAIASYLPHHKFTSAVLERMCNYIIESDPNAIIVLQADHGLHGQSEKDIRTAFDNSDQAVLDIWNGVMSAVRIPEMYGNLKSPLHPLDITRYLVNSYVGENYDYLFWDK